MAWVPINQTALAQLVTKLAALQSKLIQLKLMRKLERGKNIAYMMQHKARPDGGLRQNPRESQVETE